MTSGSREAEHHSVVLAQGGDRGAFEALYRRYAGRIYALCLRMSADAATAEDLTQDVFVRAWQKLGLFRGESSFLTWLHRLAVNLVIGHLRSQGRWERNTTELGSAIEELPALLRRSSPSAIDLERAIAELPPQARSVFVLHEIEGYRHREIADLMDLAEGTCKAHLHRARKALREVLA